MPATATGASDGHAALARQYGPAFLKMGQDQVLAWVELLRGARWMKRTPRCWPNLEGQDLLAEWTALNAQWQAANQRQADRIDLVKRAQAALLSVLLSVALTMVGFSKRNWRCV